MCVLFKLFLFPEYYFAASFKMLYLLLFLNKKGKMMLLMQANKEQLLCEFANLHPLPE